MSKLGHRVSNFRAQYLDTGAECRQEAAECWQNEKEIGLGMWLLKELQESILRLTIRTTCRNNHSLVLTRYRPLRRNFSHSPRVLDREESVAQYDDVRIVLPRHSQFSLDPGQRHLNPLLAPIRLNRECMVLHTTTVYRA